MIHADKSKGRLGVWIGMGVCGEAEGGMKKRAQLITKPHAPPEPRIDPTSPESPLSSAVQMWQ